MSHVTRIFMTVGALEGATIALAGRQFVDGRYLFEGSQKDADHLGTYLNRCWQVRVADESEVPVELQAEEEKLPEELPNNTQTLGNQRLAEALMKLDPEDDSHWTKLDKPAMSAVEAIFGSANVTRADVEAAIVGFDRTAARALKN